MQRSGGNLKAVGASDFRLRTYFMTILKSTYKTESIERGMQIKYQTYIPVLNVQTNQKLFHPIINTDNGYQEY